MGIPPNGSWGMFKIQPTRRGDHYLPESPQPQKVLAFDVYVGFDKTFVPIHVIGRAKTRELEKFAYKMGLIAVSEINGKVRPIDRGIVLDESPGLLKPLNPAEQFRRYAHFRLENLNEPTLA